MIQPFHLSFVVPDKDLAKTFYRDVLGCSIGRDNTSWCDILFFGHQLTIHQSSKQMPAYKIDHFGPVLDKEEWCHVIDACVSNNVEFVMQPKVKNEGQYNESGKFVISDPAGNLIEFKYYQDFADTVG